MPALQEALDVLDRKSNDEWMNGLEARKLAELSFHDSIRSKEDHSQDDNKKYYDATALSVNYMYDWIAENAKGKVFLDYACGVGKNTMRAASAGAELAIGLDISQFSVQSARSSAKAHGLSNARFVQGDCENTGLPSNSVDALLCCGMLHHLDLSYAIPEIRRVLKPGGRCLAVEALDYNPAIKLYRLLTPALRTEWEKKHILSLSDLRFAKRFLNVRNVRYWHLFAVPASYLKSTPLFRAALAFGNALDAVAMKVPGLQQMAWQFTFELVKNS